ncbi:alpha-L-rhamnosidase [Striga asiatica]|uniref:Alpha-L-rhamnosidase n=1 Tax=Striga asiatica TaxID=4170 RepID=A0A5A7PYB4_STRAF|nr:alpha-L-rhamnosidase [Striga asiatica]
MPRDRRPRLAKLSMTAWAFFSFDLLEVADVIGAIDKMSGLAEERAGHESGRGISGVVFLDEAYSRVDDEQHDYADKVLPVRRLSLNDYVSTYPAISQDDGHDSGGLHDPRERVPHEAEELEEFALLFLLELVGPEDLEPFVTFIARQPFSRTFQSRENFLDWNVLLQNNTT